MSSLTIHGDQWTFNAEKATPFMKKRVACLMKSGYLQLDQVVGHIWYLLVVGTKEDYRRATDMLIDES